MEDPILNTNQTSVPASSQTNPNSPVKSNKPKIFFILFVIFSILVAFIAGGFILRKPLSIFDAYQSPLDIFRSQNPCTMEAKICPDGTAVGRIGPSCEFAPCPKDTLSPTPTINSMDKRSRFDANKIQYMPDFSLPKGIEKTQLSELQKIGDTYFIQFLKSSMNVYVKSNVQRSGILYAKDGDKSWKIFYEITDLIKNSPGKNNPYNFWEEGNTYYTVIVDTAGAGSGEGDGKLISINAESKQWRIIDCFYYSPESYMEYINSLPKNTSLSEAIKAYTDPQFLKNNADYIFNENLNKFVMNNRVEENCTSLNLSL